MNRITIQRDKNYTVLSNDFIKDEELSWKAKGLITYLMHLPPDWDVYLSDLENRSSDGMTSTSSGVKELIKKGYMKRIRKHDEKGKFRGYDYSLRESLNANWES